MSLQPPENLDDEQVVYWKELVNRVHAAVNATDTPNDAPTMEQVEVIAQNIPGADDPHTGFQNLPKGWDASTVAEVWTKVGGSFTACKTKFVTEEGWSPNKADRFCAALKDEVKNSEQWREGGGQATGPLSMVPGVPNNPSVITREMLEDIVKWKMAQLKERAANAASLPPLAASLNGAVDLAAEWNPSLHPRDPDTGQFVERPWPADALPDDVNDATTTDLALFLGQTPGEPDMNRILSSGKISIDGIPDNVNSVDDLRSRANNPKRDADVPVNPATYGELNKGDIIRTPDGSPARVKGKDVYSDERVVTVETPDGSTEEIDMDTVRRNTLDVYDVSSMSELPSQGGGEGDVDRQVDLSNLSTDHRAWESTMDMANTLSAGDIIQVKRGEFDSAGERRRAEYVPARILEKSRGIGESEMVVEYADGDTQTIDRNEDYRVGGVFNPPSGVSGDPAEEWVGTDPTDPESGEWLDKGARTLDEGDVVRFNSPRTMELEVGQVIGQRSMGGVRVQTADGQTFAVDDDENREKDVYELKGVFRAEQDRVLDNPDQLPTADDVGTMDLTKLDGTPAERREAVRGELGEAVPPEAVRNEEIPEGTLIAQRRGSGENWVYEVTGYEEKFGKTRLKVRSWKNRQSTYTPSWVKDHDFRFYHPGDKAKVTISDSEWGDEDTARSKRKDAVRSVLDDVLTTADNDPANSDDVLDADTFDKAKDTIAGQLAKANDKQHAERVVAKLTSIGKRSRAHAVIEQSVIEDTTGWIGIDEDEDDDVIVHELGHIVGDVYDMRGGSNDMDGNTHPMTNFKWQSPDYEVPQKYGMKTPPWHEDFDEDKSVTEQPSYGLDNWRDEVDRQVGTGLDGRNFTTPESSEDVPSEPGGMIRVENDIGFNEPRIWRITEVDEDAGFDDQFDVELESRDGKTAGGRVKNQFGEPRIEFDNIGSPTGNEIVGKRNSTPDNWKEDPPDADDWLGTMDFDSADDAVHKLGEMVNKAWYRQAAATREHGGQQASDYSILGGYSSKQAHETMSRIHHVMTPSTADTGYKVKNEKRAEAARALVKYHPDLLETYLNVYDIPVEMKQYLNAVLEQEGHDFRFDAPSEPNMDGIETPSDAVRDLYRGED